ncbi:MAG TPA: thiamine phosphate synthase [Kofleriaceae bacterium]|nr:thiamine phosphate synthase [Kofleriaceae bacterium]
MLDAIRVVAITDRRMMGATHEAFGAAIAAAVGGCPPGSVLVQVREKDLDGGELLALVRIAQRYAPVAVNDRVDVALAAGAIAVHLPEDGLAVADARALFPRTIGVSRHAPDADSGADYLHLGPIFPTPSKPGVPALGLDVLAAPHGRTKLVAIGGIDTPDKAHRAAQAGADAVAVIRAAWTGESLAPYVAAVQAGIALRQR